MHAHAHHHLQSKQNKFFLRISNQKKEKKKKNKQTISTMRGLTCQDGNLSATIDCDSLNLFIYS